MRLFSLCAIVRHTPFQEKRAGRDKGIGVSVLPHQLYIIDIAAAGKAPRIVRPENQEALRPFLPDACSSVLVRTGLSSGRLRFSVNVNSSRFPGMKGSPVTRSQMTRRISAESPLTRRIRFCTTEKLISIPLFRLPLFHGIQPAVGMFCQASTRDSRSAIFCRLASVSDSWRRSSAMQSRRLRTDHSAA